MKIEPHWDMHIENCMIGCIVNCIINCIVNPKRLAGIQRCVRHSMHSTGKALGAQSEARAGAHAGGPGGERPCIRRHRTRVRKRDM